MKLDSLKKLYVEELRDLYSAETQLLKALPKMAKAAGCAAWSPNQGAVTETLVKEAQSLGLKVVPWTVNDPAVMDRLIGWGVDGLISDYPDHLRAVMAKRGMVLPAAAK